MQDDGQFDILTYRLSTALYWLYDKREGKKYVPEVEKKSALVYSWETFLTSTIYSPIYGAED